MLLLLILTIRCGSWQERRGFEAANPLKHPRTSAVYLEFAVSELQASFISLYKSETLIHRSENSAWLLESGSERPKLGGVCQPPWVAQLTQQLGMPMLMCVRWPDNSLGKDTDNMFQHISNWWWSWQIFVIFCQEEQEPLSSALGIDRGATMPRLLLEHSNQL